MDTSYLASFLGRLNRDPNPPARPQPGQRAEAELSGEMVFLYEWHQRFDRFFLRHQNFLSELSCKLVVVAVILADYYYTIVATSTDPRWGPTITTGMNNSQRISLIWEMIYLTGLIVVTHFVVSKLLSVLEDIEDRTIAQKEREQAAHLNHSSGGDLSDLARSETPILTPSNPRCLISANHGQWDDDNDITDPGEAIELAGVPSQVSRDVQSPAAIAGWRCILWDAETAQGFHRL